MSLHVRLRISHSCLVGKEIRKRWVESIMDCLIRFPSTCLLRRSWLQGRSPLLWFFQTLKQIILCSLFLSNKSNAKDYKNNCYGDMQSLSWGQGTQHRPPSAKGFHISCSLFCDSCGTRGYVNSYGNSVKIICERHCISYTYYIGIYAITVPTF